MEPWALPSQISPSLLLGLDEEVSLSHTSPPPRTGGVEACVAAPT